MYVSIPQYKIIMHTEIQNFLPSNIANEIENTLLRSGYFPWYYTEYVAYSTEIEKDDIENYYFLHQFFRDGEINSNYFDIIVPILEKLDIKKIIRAKANLYTNINKFKKFGWHQDTIQNCKTVIYYVNDNNGYTGFLNNINIKSQKNKILLMDNNEYHYATNCTNKKARCVININYE